MSDRSPCSDPSSSLRLPSRTIRNGRPAARAAVAALLLALPGVAAPAGAAEIAFAESHTPDHGQGSSPRFLFRAAGGGALFMAKREPADPAGCLWRTDGSLAGTAPIPGCPVVPSSRFEALVGGRLFFPAHPDGASGGPPELWTSDGTLAGTRPLTDLSPGGGVHLLTIAGSDEPLRVGFLADDGIHGFEPWVSDGTPAGTHLLVDLTAGGDGTGVGGMVIFEGKLFFLVVAPDGSYDLWASDFTAEGTAPVAALPASQLVIDRPLLGTEGIVFGTRDLDDCSGHVWGSDGTAAGTRELAAFADHCNGFRFRTASAEGAPFAAGALYFLADDGVHGREVWRTDGAVAERITDLALDEPFAQTQLFFPALLGGKLYFIAKGGPGVGTELFSTDGTPASTDLVADICSGDCSGLQEGMFPALAGGKLFFAADDGVHDSEPWVTDGTEEGTRMRTDVCAGTCSSVFIGGTVSARGFLLQVAFDQTHGEEVWRTDPATGAMNRLTDLGPPTPFFLHHFVDVAHGVVFAADDGPHGSELWVTDGTPAGTRLLANLLADPGPVTEPPAAPHSLRGQATYLGGVVQLAWEPGAGGGAVERWVVEARSPGFDWTVVAELAGNPPQPVVVLSLEDDTPYTFRVRAENSAGASGYSAPFSLTTLAFYEEDPCTTGQGLCLQGGRFLVEVDWRNQHAGPGDPKTGVGVPVEGTELSGHFWFFRPDNLELIVKVLDGTPVNGFYWTFYGALTDVEYWITVTDLTSLERRTYHNPPGQVCGRGDTASIGALAGATAHGSAGADAAGPQVAAGGAAAATGFARGLVQAPDTSLPRGSRAIAFDAAPRSVRAGAHPAEPCVPDAQTLCLLGGRFRVRVTWTDQHNGGTGVGTAMPYADRTGFFTFFNPANVELVVKVLDGTPVNGKIWVFYGALSDVGYRITVDDMADGHAGRQYVNPPGNICGQADTAAF